MIILITSSSDPSVRKRTRDPSRRSDPSARVKPRAKANVPARLDPREEEESARKLYQAAVAHERANPDAADKNESLFRAVTLKHPGTTWASKAEAKVLSVGEAAPADRKDKLEEALKEARKLAAAGRPAKALEALKNLASGGARGMVRHRAKLEIAAIRNDLHVALNKAVAGAKPLAAAGEYDKAAALFAAVKTRTIPDVAARCDVAIAQLQAAAKEHAKHRQSRETIQAWEAVVATEAPKALKALRERRYGDGLAILQKAAANPAYAPVKQALDDETAAVEEAGQFWKAFEKALKKQVDKEASFLLLDGKRVSGKLARVETARAFFRTAEGFAIVKKSEFHPDVLVSMTIGRALPSESPQTSMRAALFFTFDGRDDLARLYFATAREDGGKIERFERVFRRGLLRAAAAANTKPEIRNPK